MGRDNHGNTAAQIPPPGTDGFAPALPPCCYTYSVARSIGVAICDHWPRADYMTPGARGLESESAGPSAKAPCRADTPR
jgi:hypothetical protein